MSRIALVIGAGGAVGEAAAIALVVQGWRVTGSMRTRRGDVVDRLRQQGISVAFHDIARDQEWAQAAAACDAVVCCTDLRVTVAALSSVEPMQTRIVAFSSNNVAIHTQAKVYRELAAAEEALRRRYADAAIIRPTLIYGDPRLPTLSRVLRMAHAWPLVPLPGSGKARVQPVFHEDVGRIAAGLAANGAGGTYAAGGPEIVTMRALFDAALRVTRGRGRVLPIPAGLLTTASPLLSELGLFSADQARRADHDRIAVTQTPLPAELTPRTDLMSGLSRHWAAINSATGG